MPNPTPPYPMPDDLPEDVSSLQQDNRDLWLSTTQRLSGTYQGNPAFEDPNVWEYPSQHDMIIE